MATERKHLEPNRAKLNFFRWMAENDRLEHAVAGKSTGEYAGLSPDGKPTLKLKLHPNNTHYAEVETEAELRAAILLKIPPKIGK